MRVWLGGLGSAKLFRNAGFAAHNRIDNRFAECAVNSPWPGWSRVLCSWLLLSAAASHASGQQPPVDVPPKFTRDMETAAQLRPQLLAQSVAAAGRYTIGSLVLQRLAGQIAKSSSTFSWQIRIVEDGALNAYASPDGTVYVESGLANLAGESTGLWAAIVSHEMAHVLRRDWARRYLFQKSLEGSSATIVLDEPGLPSGSWTDAQKGSADLARFCREMEIEADRAGLQLMARAGYHPDFTPALHHLLHAQSGTSSKSLYAMHPCWQERDKELGRAYLEARTEFERLWPEWYASPGGNPPVVVFAEEPTIKKVDGTAWQLQIPMRCQNLAGAVEVVLRVRTSALHAARSEERERRDSSAGESGTASNKEVRKLTGCTSPRTTVTFTLGDVRLPSKASAEWTGIYVLDAWGAVLARAEVPRRPR